MDDAVRVPTVFTKNRKRLIKHDAMIEYFNEVQAIAEKKVWLSGEHFSMDGTPIQARAGHKSFVRKADNQNNGDGGNFKGSKRSNETHQSKTDPDSRLYRKGNNTGSELRYIGHTLGDNRHGLIVNAMVIKADGYAEREAASAMINDARQALGGVCAGLPIHERHAACCPEQVRPQFGGSRIDRAKHRVCHLAAET